MASPQTKKRKTADQRAACGVDVTVTLPDHVVTEVLLRLPARTLARLRCACRSWNAEVSSPVFQHRHHALAAAKLVFLERAPTHMGSFRIRIGVGMPWFRSCFNCPRVIGSKPCWGLVLIARPCEGYSSTIGNHDDSFLGFTDDDAASIDSDVQPVFADGCLHWSFRTNYLDKPHGVLSFSLADESFRRVPQPPFSMVDLVPADWSRNYRLLRSKGIRSESGEEVAMPVGKTLAELDGCLCMVRDVRHRSDVGGLLFEIWKLQDYDTGSWSLDYRVDLQTPAACQRQLLTAPWLVFPLRYLDDGGGGGSRPGEMKRKLLVATTTHEAHVYDPDSGTLRTVASIDGREDSSGDDAFLRLFLYQESLVRFPGMKHGEGKIKVVQLES
uniref:F-box domain-containing protein n=1 Tax=Oryza punctata TaxID=4537 RepID=A0A0E0JEI5_ORYPU